MVVIWNFSDRAAIRIIAVEFPWLFGWLALDITYQCNRNQLCWLTLNSINPTCLKRLSIKYQIIVRPSLNFWNLHAFWVYGFDSWTWPKYWVFILIGSIQEWRILWHTRMPWLIDLQFTTGAWDLADVRDIFRSLYVVRTLLTCPQTCPPAKSHTRPPS